MSRPSIHPRRTMLAAIVMTIIAGCGYTVRPPFNRAIRTVYVPMFKSTRFRRELNIQFTEMLQDEIRTRTPYLVVGNPEGADATLEGTITLDDKNLVLENPNNLPRQLQAMLFCSVTFIDNRNGARSIKTTPPALVTELTLFAPEIGETASLGFQKAMKKMAQDIVGMMEDPWGDEYRVDEDLAPVEEADASEIPKARIPRR